MDDARSGPLLRALRQGAIRALLGTGALIVLAALVGVLPLGLASACACWGFLPLSGLEGWVRQERRAFPPWAVAVVCTLFCAGVVAVAAVQAAYLETLLGTHSVLDGLTDGVGRATLLLERRELALALILTVAAPVASITAARSCEWPERQVTPFGAAAGVWLPLSCACLVLQLLALLLLRDLLYWPNFAQDLKWGAGAVQGVGVLLLVLLCWFFAGTDALEARLWPIGEVDA
ncbi:MAG: hypothetical protein AB7N76_30445 [Planctomycetota bacterium]